MPVMMYNLEVLRVMTRKPHKITGKGRYEGVISLVISCPGV